MPQFRKGISPLLTSAVYIAIGIATIAILINGLTSFGNEIQDTATINNVIETMPALENTIRSVASAGEGTHQQFRFTYQKGELKTYPGGNSIEYTIDTSSRLITPKSSRRIGNILVSAGAEVGATQTTVNKTDCWQLSNKYVQTCIKTVEEADHTVVGYWPTDNASGQTVYDNSRYTNDGILGSTDGTDTNDPARTTDCKAGRCLNFDGSDDYVNTTDIQNGSITIMAWFKLDQQPGSGTSNTLVASNDASTTQGLHINFNNGALEGTIQDGENTSTVTSSSFTTTDIDTWKHVAVTINASNDTSKLYLDGEQIDSDTSAHRHRTADKPLLIGAYHNPPAQQFDGQIDEVAVYNRSLTQREIEARYETLIYDKSFITTNNLLVSYYNKEKGTYLKSPVIETHINGNNLSRYGFGFTEIDTLGEGLPYGQVTAHITPITPVAYDLDLTLVSGSDFIEATVRPN